MAVLLMWSLTGLLLLTGCRSESVPQPVVSSVEEVPVIKNYTIRDAQITARNTSFSDSDVDRLLADPGLSVVTGLDLTGARLSADALERLLADPRLAGLRRLHIGSSTVGDAGLLVIGQAPAAPGLEVLDVPRIGATPGGIATFAAQARLGGVALSIGHQEVGDIGATGLAQCAGVGRLDLESGQVGTAGAVALLSHTAATRISFRDNPIHLDNLEAISPALQNISFKMTPLTEADLHALAGAPAPGLRELNFEQVPITDSGLEAVQNAPWLAQLEALSIGAPGTSTAARRAFLEIWGSERGISIQRREL